MASAFSHAVAAAAIGSVFYGRGLPARFWVLGAACAIAPDVDVIGVALGVSFRSLLGHRGLSHSLVFAAVLAAVVVPAFFARMREELSREWTNLVASVSKAFPQTTAAWFVERTLMSLFSSAAWRCAFPSIVEAKAR